MHNFAINQIIIYPGHGIGKITTMETRNIFGDKCQFYIIETINTGIKLMVPINDVDSLGIRPVISKKIAEKALSIFKRPSHKKTRHTWNKLYREYMKKLTNGSICEIADILKDIYNLKLDKELSFGERKIIYNSYNLFKEEISLVIEKNNLPKHISE